jgi:hypothetical protein
MGVSGGPLIGRKFGIPAFALVVAEGIVTCAVLACASMDQWKNQRQRKEQRKDKDKDRLCCLQ